MIERKSAFVQTRKFLRRCALPALSAVALVACQAALAQCWSGAPNGQFASSPACGDVATNNCVYDTCVWSYGYSCDGKTILTYKVQNPPPSWYRCKGPGPGFGGPYRCGEDYFPCGGINTAYIDQYCTKACTTGTVVGSWCGAMAGSTPCPL